MISDLRLTYNTENHCKVPANECLDCEENCCKTCFGAEGGRMFKTLSGDELNLLTDNKRRVKFKSGETVLKQNTGSSHLICIRRGTAKLFVEGVREKNLILKIIKDSDIIISGGVLTQSTRPFTVTAISDLECCFISSEKVFTLLQTNTNFAISFLEKYHQQFNQMFLALVNMTQKYMPGRVADTLLYLKNQVFYSNPFNCPLNRQELSEMSAMTKESFVRILTEFKNSNLIRTDGRIVEILNEEALIEISKNG
jgi:CRP-like cAMP-binding protein